MPKSCVSVVIFLVVHVSGCAAPPLYSYIIYEDPTSFVRLEVSPEVDNDEPETFHSHPEDLSNEQLTQIFQGLLVREHRSSLLLLFMDLAESVPAFTPKEVMFLSQHVGKALRQAVPRELVTFYMSRPLNATTREVTSGAVFIQSNQFHFMLRNYRTVYNIPPFGLVYDRRHPAYSLMPRNIDVMFQPSDLTIPTPVSFFENLVGETHDGEIILDLSRFSTLRL